MTGSQNSEDRFVLNYFQRAGTALELGAGDGITMSNTNLLKYRGWNIRQVDINNQGNKAVEQWDITKYSINWKLQGSPTFDFVSIDIDGNDYWVLAALLKVQRPLLICCEVNSQLPLNESITINYDDKRKWSGNYNYGMSYLAAEKLLNGSGYSVISCLNNQNLMAAFTPDNIQNIDRSEYGATFSHPEIMGENDKWIQV